MSETLENAKGKDDITREVYASLYLDALRMQLEEYKCGECNSFEEMDEEILEDIDVVIEDTLAEIQPDLFIKRFKGLQFIIIPWEALEKKIIDTEE